MELSKINILKNKIEDEIKRTQEKIANYIMLCKPIAPENSIGRISRMDAINNKSVVEAALREAKSKLKQLYYMKTKMKKQDFDKCSRCKKEIPFDRLLIMPQSTTCVNCAQ